MFKFNLQTNWKQWLDQFSQEDWFIRLMQQVEFAYQTKVVYPKQENLFHCLNFFNIEDTKVVILGQDPYFNPNQANGLSFSLNPGNKPTKSLINIFKELENDTGIKRTNVDLTDWATQGVLLLNCILSVEQSKPMSHQIFGWEKLTDLIIKTISEQCFHVVFILWGNYAINKKHLIDDSKHLIITSSHPSPLSARHSFFNSKCFSKTNSYLISQKLKPIKW